jgi:hypothetical protein
VLGLLVAGLQNAAITDRGGRGDDHRRHGQRDGTDGLGTWAGHPPGSPVCKEMYRFVHTKGAAVRPIVR